VIVGCVYGRKRVYEVGYPTESSSGGGGGTASEVLAGPIVAYEIFSHGPEGGGGKELQVQDLRNGRLIHRVDAGADAIVLKSDGSMAWIGGLGTNLVRGVYTLDKSGQHLLASGPDIDPQSLALAGSTLYWTQDGKPFSGSLN
jgi:hypothetical protein